VEVLYAVGGIVLFLLIAIFVSYNRFIEQRQLMNDAWANIDTELQRRYDLIPNLVETVKGYAAHERAVFEEVTAARAAASASHGSPAEQARDEQQLVQSLLHLFAVAEGYPTLQASTNFLALQRELATTEDRIQVARRFFNANVRNFNRRVQAFPSNIMAWAMHLTEAEYFEVEAAVRSAGPPQVSPAV
jgi:LemA protein